MSGSDLTGLGLRLLLSNFWKTVGRQMWAALLQLGTVVLIARAYGPQGNGLYSVALLLPAMLALLLALGIGAANVYYLASRRYSLRAVTSTTLRLWAVLALIGLAGGLLVVRFYADRLFPDVPALTLYITLLAFPPMLFVTLVGSLFQGVEDFSSFNLSLSLQPALSLLGIVFCVLAGFSASHAVGAYVVGSGGASLALAWRLHGKLATAPGEGPVRPYPVSEALSYGVRSHLGSILAFLNLRIDLFLLNFFTSPVLAGIYVVALQLAERIWMLSQAVTTVLLPRLSSLAKDGTRSMALLALASRMTLLATLLMTVVAAAIGMKLITWLFGVSYQSAYIPFLIMLPGILAGSCVRILAAEFSSRGRPELNTYLAFVVVAVGVLCNIVLIPRHGAVGAALSSSIAYVVSLLIRLVMYRRFVGQSALNLLVPKYSDVAALLGHLKDGRVPKS